MPASTVKVLEIDLFDPQSLRDPFADYRRLRNAGGVVKLKQLGVNADAIGCVQSCDGCGSPATGPPCASHAASAGGSSRSARAS